MAVKIGVLCSDESPELAALIRTVYNGQLPLDIKIVITDKNSSALRLVREAGFYGCFVPRSAFHANQDGFERRLIELFTEFEVNTLILANFFRETGPILQKHFSKIIKIDGFDLNNIDVQVDRSLRGGSFSLLK